MNESSLVCGYTTLAQTHTHRGKISPLFQNEASFSPPGGGRRHVSSCSAARGRNTNFRCFRRISSESGNMTYTPCDGNEAITPGSHCRALRLGVASYLQADAT